MGESFNVYIPILYLFVSMSVFINDESLKSEIEN